MKTYGNFEYPLIFEIGQKTAPVKKVPPIHMAEPSPEFPLLYETPVKAM
jgi:hypothetical protein